MSTILLPSCRNSVKCPPFYKHCRLTFSRNPRSVLVVSLIHFLTESSLIGIVWLSDRVIKLNKFSVPTLSYGLNGTLYRQKFPQIFISVDFLFVINLVFWLSCWIYHTFLEFSLVTRSEIHLVTLLENFYSVKKRFSLSNRYLVLDVLIKEGTKLTGIRVKKDPSEVNKENRVDYYRGKWDFS